MAKLGISPLPGLRLNVDDDLLDFWQLRAHFNGPFVEHHSLYSDASRRIRNQLEIKQWRRVDELGEGAFGKVFLEEEMQGGLRAVKQLQKSKYKEKTMDYLREILAMANLSRDGGYFVQLYGWFSDDQAIYIAMEFAPHGDLHDCVKHPLPEVEVRNITQQIVEALEILHSKNFAHRDLKPSNVFVIEKGPSWWVKLGDLGVSKRVANEMTRYKTSIDTDFSAPEVIGYFGVGAEEASSYTKAVDVWSLGCLVHWLLTLELPLTRRQLHPFCMGRFDMPQKHLRDHLVSSTCIDFVATLLQPGPELRPTAAQMMKEKWFEELRPGGFLINHETPQPRTMDILDPQSPSVLRRLPEADLPNRERRRSSQDWTAIPAAFESEIDVDTLGVCVQIEEPKEEQTEQTSNHKRKEEAKSRREQDYARDSAYEAPLARFEGEADTSKESAERILTEPSPLQSTRSIVGQPDHVDDLQGTTQNSGNGTQLFAKSDFHYSQTLADADSEQSTSSLTGATIFGSETREILQDNSQPVIIGSLNLDKADVHALKLTGLPNENRNLPEQELSKNPLPAEPTLATNTGMPPNPSMESKVMDQFKKFAEAEKVKLQEHRRLKASQDRTTRLNDLMRFSQSFKLKTPVPTDIVGILSKDPAKQEQIIEKAKKEVEETKYSLNEQWPVATWPQRPPVEDKHLTPSVMVRMPPNDAYNASNGTILRGTPQKPIRTSWAQVAALDSSNSIVKGLESKSRSETQSEAVEGYPFTAKNSQRKQRRKAGKEKRGSISQTHAQRS